MKKVSILLLGHGLLEVLAGLGMIIFTTEAFPFTAVSPELQMLGKSFGIAIIALGITALLSLKSHTKGTLVGAFSYHTIITILMWYQFLHSIGDIQNASIAVVIHGTLAIVFLISILKYKI